MGDFSAGVSSALTFGLSDKLIAATGLGKYGSKCSGAYFLGNLAGQALFIVGGSLATIAESAVAEGAEAVGAARGVGAVGPYGGFFTSATNAAGGEVVTPCWTSTPFQPRKSVAI